MPFHEVVSGIFSIAETGLKIGQAIAGGDDTTIQGLELPVQFESEFLNRVLDDLQALDADIVQTDTLEKELNERFDILDAIVKGTIPSAESLRLLTESSARIAQAFGDDVEEAIAQGFLAEEDKAELDTLKAGHLVDERLEGKQADERARLEQQLSRDGVSPAIRRQALDRLARDQREESFDRSSGLIQNRLGILGSREDLRQRGFDRAVGGFNVVQSQLGFARQGAAALGTSAVRRNDTGLQAIDARQRLRQEGRQTFKDVGGFRFSDKTKGDLAAGRITGGGGVLSDKIVGAGAPTPGGAIDTVNFDNLTDSSQRLVGKVGSLSDDRLLKSVNEGGGSPVHIGGSGSDQELRETREIIMREARRRGLIQ